MDLIITDHHECKAGAAGGHRRGRPAPAGLSPRRTSSWPASASPSSWPAAHRRQDTAGGAGALLRSALPRHGGRRHAPGRARTATFVADGLQALQSPQRVGLRGPYAGVRRACHEADHRRQPWAILLAPRINAAGRMGQVELAMELFLTDSAHACRRAGGRRCASSTARRQEIEAEIYRRGSTACCAPCRQSRRPPSSWRATAGIRALSASWRPDWRRNIAWPASSLICLDGDKGKASSRSATAAFNLFAALRAALGSCWRATAAHELAAGFTIRRDQDRYLPRARSARWRADYQQIRRAPTPRWRSTARSQPSMLTLANVASSSTSWSHAAQAAHARSFLCAASDRGAAHRGRRRQASAAEAAPVGAISFSAIFFSTNRQRSRRRD